MCIHVMCTFLYTTSYMSFLWHQNTDSSVKCKLPYIHRDWCRCRLSLWQHMSRWQDVPDVTTSIPITSITALEIHSDLSSRFNGMNSHNKLSITAPEIHSDLVILLQWGWIFTIGCFQELPIVRIHPRWNRKTRSECTSRAMIDVIGIDVVTSGKSYHLLMCCHSDNLHQSLCI